MMHLLKPALLGGLNRETLLLVSLKPSCRFQPENQSAEFLPVAWLPSWLPLCVALLCFLFSCDAPPQSSETCSLSAPGFDQRASALCPEDAGPSIFWSLFISPWSLLGLCFPLSCHPKTLGGHDSYSSSSSSWLWAPLQPQRLENSFWRWTIFPPDSLARLLSSSLLYLDPVARAIWEIWMFVVRLQEEKPLWCHLWFDFSI